MWMKRKHREDGAQLPVLCPSCVRARNMKKTVLSSIDTGLSLPNQDWIMKKTLLQLDKPAIL